MPDNPALWRFCILLPRIVHKVKSHLLAKLFKAPGLYLGRGSTVRGVNHITFGRNLYAHGNLWLEAVAEYRGQRFSPRIEIGDNVSFSDGVHITCIHSIVLKPGILMGSRVYISDHNHGIYKGDFQSHPSEPPSFRQLGGGGRVIIGENVWIGDNVVIVGPVVIGDGAIIGANSFVNKDVAPQTIVGGITAKALKHFDVPSNTWSPT